MEKVIHYGYKFKCPWCGFLHYTSNKISPCHNGICPLYREVFRIVHDSLKCLACATPCDSLKAPVVAIITKSDPALRGVNL